MRRMFITVSLGAAGIFGAGLLIGQLQGMTPAAAASKHTTKTHAAKTGAASHQSSTTGTPHADGTVTAVNGNTITIKADADPAGSTEYTGVTKIVLSSSTTFKGTTTKASIVAGAYLVAEGTLSSNGTTLTATSVGLGGHGGGHGGRGGPSTPHADGTIAAVNGNTISVTPDTDAAGSTEYTKVTTVLLTASTTYNYSATKASLVAGAKFDAEGTLSSDGTTLTATSVGIR